MIRYLSVCKLNLLFIHSILGLPICLINGVFCDANKKWQSTPEFSMATCPRVIYLTVELLFLWKTKTKLLTSCKRYLYPKQKAFTFHLKEIRTKYLQKFYFHTFVFSLTYWYVISYAHAPNRNNKPIETSQLSLTHFRKCHQCNGYNFFNGRNSLPIFVSTILNFRTKGQRFTVE